MARPKKENADYFSHDADMRNNIKVKALRRKFQHKGYAVWCFMLEALTNAEHFEISLDAINEELLAADFDVSVEELKAIVEYCCKIDLLQVADGYVSSQSHKERFGQLIEKRERDRERFARKMEVWNRQREQKFQEEFGDVSVSENPAETQNNNNSRSENPQRKGNNNTNQTKGQSKKQTKDRYPYQDIIALWNEVCTSLPSVKSLNDNRRKKIRCRLEEWGDSEKWLETARELFGMVEESDFLSGRNGKWTSCSFDWLFANGENWVKVSEGNYINKGPRAGQHHQGGVVLGPDERIENGRRTYGTGAATIPMTAPARPSDKHCWDELSQTWVVL